MEKILKKKKKEKSITLQKANIKVEVCRRNKNCDLKERKNFPRCLFFLVVEFAPSGWAWTSALDGFLAGGTCVHFGGAGSHLSGRQHSLQ